MIAAWKQIFNRSAQYALLCPLLFLIPVGIELLQHWAEVHIGMYDSYAAAEAVEHHPLRMVVGHVKILSLILTGYWATRFFALGSEAAARPDPAGVRLYAWVIAWALLWTVLLQDGPMIAAALGLNEKPVLVVALTVMVVIMLFETCLSAWKVAAPLGNARIGFLRSIGMVRGSFWWGTALLFLTVLPLLVAHYALSFAAIGAGAATMWTVLVVDSVLTGFLGVVMIALNYAVAERMSVRHREPLLGEPSPSTGTFAPA
jgi:hypothetical protein